MLQIDLSGLDGFCTSTFLLARTPRLADAHNALQSGSGAGGAFTGWVRLPETCDPDTLLALNTAAAKIQSDSQALVVIGIGGSYLGARAVIDLLRSPYYNLKRKSTPDIFFAGCGLSADHLTNVLELVQDRDFSINVISKSGSTIEPALAFRLFRAALERKYGKEGARSRIYVTTDGAGGALRSLAKAEGYQTFVIPDDIGGRYSVLTPVGLLPIAVSGIQIDRLMAGAAAGMRRFGRKEPDNPAWQYAAARNFLYEERGKVVELLACIEPSSRYLCEWWKQLFGESEGKEHKGLFPASVEYTADLHSLGQYIQEGSRLLFETVLDFPTHRDALTIGPAADDADGLGYLAHQTFGTLKAQALRGTRLAHMDGGVPNLLITLSELDEAALGELIYFFQWSCGLSGYLLGVNPFDQPGVEAYKKNMFALLGKPGYEALRQTIENRLAGKREFS